MKLRILSGRARAALSAAMLAVALGLLAAGLPAFAQPPDQSAQEWSVQGSGRSAEPAQVASARPDAAPRSLAAKAASKVKQAAARTADIFRRVPCRSPKRIGNTVGALPHVARKLAEHKPVTIIAFGSSSTEGYGSTSPQFTYPNRLAAQLKRKFPSSSITVLNRGRGGEDAPEMMKRLQNAVLDEKPDLVIWQVGTNAILRNLDPAATMALVRDGIAQIKAAGADVVLVDPQYVPAVNQKGEHASRMVKMLSSFAGQHRIGLFPRFEVMREWHDDQALAFDRFSIADGLHMNDWGYACFAQLLGDDIIKSVGEVRTGANPPSGVLTYRPL